MQNAKNVIIKVSWADIEFVVKVIDKSCNIKSFDYILAITRGGWIPSVILSNKHGIEVLPFQIRLTANDEPNADKNKLEIGQNIDFSILKNKKVLVVDDIFGSGITLSHVKNVLSKFTPTIVSTVVCYMNTNNYKKEYDLPDFIGKKVQGWIMFPWESKGR